MSTSVTGMYRRQELPDSLRNRTHTLSNRGLSKAGITGDGIRSLVGRELTRLGPDLYVLGTDPTWEQYLRAALELGGPQAVAFRRTALALHGLADRVLPVEILTPSTDQPKRRSWAWFGRSDLNRLVLRSDIPRVGLEDTIIDVAGVRDELGAIALVSRALQERRTQPSRLATVIEARRRVRHRPLLERILEDAAGVESVLERVYDDRVAGPHDLPPMVRQYVVPETGHRADGAYLEGRKLLELDGARYHDAEADRRLDNRHAALGWATFRFGWADCWTDPCTTARVISGGAPPKRCRRCPADPPAPGR